MAKYLDLDGLAHYDERIKQYVDSGDEAVRSETEALSIADIDELIR